MFSKINIKKGDKVCVISGVEKGKEGVVKLVRQKGGFVIVEGMNRYKKSKKLDQNNKDNFILIERGIHFSNVKVVSKGNIKYQKAKK